MILHGKARRCVCRNPAYIDSDMTLSSAVVVWMGVMRAQSTDHAFLTKVAQAGEGEVMVAQDAQKKGAASEVKALAQRLEADHRKANSELRALIAKKRLTVPGGPTLEQKSPQEQARQVARGDVRRRIHECDGGQPYEIHQRI
jgi:predicted outer membrane protein